MSLVCQYTIMSPTASSAPADQQPTRLNQRRNAMANVHAGISSSDINQIKEQAPACLTTAQPTCLSTTGSPTMRGGVASSEASGLSAMAFQATMPAAGDHSTSSPLQSPGLKHRRNAVPDVLAVLDEGNLGRILAARASREASLHNDQEDDHQHEFTF